MAAPGTPGGRVLTDVVAFVDVWSFSKRANFSKGFIDQLVAMGAEVTKRFNKRVTHVVFNDGHWNTWDKAQKKGVKLVSVLWVEKCRTTGTHVDESQFPATNSDEHLPHRLRKKHKCMQPKEFILQTPENNKRLRKKLEKMVSELEIERQQKALDNDKPVFLFDSNDSLIKTYCGYHSAMEKRLQEMKEERENLSPTASQMSEKSDENPVNSSCEGCLNISHDTSCSGKSFAADLHLSFDDLGGNSEHGDQERKSRGFADGIKSDMCVSSPVLKTSSVHPSASPTCLGQLPPQKSMPLLSEEENDWLQGAVGGVVTPDKKRSEGAAEEVFEEGSLSLVVSATTGHCSGLLRPKSSSAKRKRTSEHFHSPVEERPTAKSDGRLADHRLLLLKPEGNLQLGSRPTGQCPNWDESSYDDYFSPDNLAERNSVSLLPGCRSSSSPTQFRWRSSLSKRERAHILAMSDFSCIGKNPRSVDATNFTAKISSSLQKPRDKDADTALGGVTAEQTSGTEGTAGCCSHADAERRGGACLDGRHSPYTTDDHAHQKGQHDDLTPLDGSDKAVKELVDVKHVQKEDTTSRTLSPSEDVKTGPVRRGGVESPREVRRDLSGPREESKRRGRGKKPTRTLVMTSMPSEQQDMVIRIVNELKGFSVASEVCRTTTHVLAGKPLRTLNVLLGIARGCWILSYEWVLWSLELGHWISEEPFELSDSFPAAPLCRRERCLPAGQPRDALFADQPWMFISPASEPPKAKLRELVRLCGGRVAATPDQAGVFIGPSRGEKKATLKYLSEKWILDSVTQHKVCAPENYVLQ